MSAYLIRPYFSTFSRMPPPSTVDTTTGSYLLTSETDGFAINAISASQTPAYSGAPYAGSVCVIDTGTPANNLSNVALDSSNLVQSGTSPKMVLWNSSPYVRWTPHNIVIQSQTFDNAAWTKGNSTVSANATTAPDGSSTADTLIEASDVAQLHSASATTATGVSGFPYTVSVYVKAASGSRRLVLNLGDTAGANGVYSVFDIAGAQVGVTSTAYGSGYTASGSPTISTVGSGWYRYEFAIISGGTELRMTCNLDNGSGTAALSQTYNGNGTSGLHLWGAQVCRGYNANPYLVTTSAARIGIPQEYDTAASKFGILVEPAATNLLMNSEDFDSWTKISSSVSTNTTTAPDGSSTADTINMGGSPYSGVREQIILGAGATLTYSMFLKQTGTSSWAFINYSDNTANAAGAYFDLTNGVTGATETAGTATLISKSIVSVGNSWYRCIITVTNPTANATPSVFPVNGDNVGGAASAGNAVYAWGAQAEAGSVATSYIPTLGSTVTRAVDDETALLSTIPYSTTVGTIYVDAKRPYGASGAPSSAPKYWSTHTDNGVHDEEVNTQFGVGTVTEDFAVETGTVFVVQMQIGSAAAANARTQVSAAWQVNNFAGSIQGGAAVTDTSGGVPTGQVALQIGDRQQLDRPLCGYIYRLVYVPRRVTDGDLPNWRYNY